MDDSEEVAESTAPATIAVTRKTLIAAIAAAVVLSLATLAATAAYFVSQAEVAHLQHAARQAQTDQATAARRYDELRLAYGQMIAAQRCEVIDGLDDCVAAGLTRPARFAESDRQQSAARRAREVQRAAEESAAHVKPGKARAEHGPVTTAEAAPESRPEPARIQPATPAAQTASGKISLGEFVVEIKKIPGVALEPVQQERAAGERKERPPR